MKFNQHLGISVALAQLLLIGPALAADKVVYQGKTGPGQGKHIALLAGDEEYRSEEGLPMLAKILAVRHGFKCTVVFPINPADGTIDPLTLTNLPGIAALDSADLCVMGLRFRELPDEQMKHFADYLNAGKPFIALRTSTHAFKYDHHTASPYAKYDWHSTAWPGGFGQQVLGETWVDHHGHHGFESTRGDVSDAWEGLAILQGVANIWVPTDVYTVIHLPKDAEVLVYGEVLSGMKPTDPAVKGPKNDPMMPVAWRRNYTGEKGKTCKVFTTTMGAAVDLENEGLRRLLVNAAYWAVGLEKQIPARANVDYVGDYKPGWFGFGKYKKGLRPEDLELRR
jgi:Trehalose utilisation